MPLVTLKKLSIWTGILGPLKPSTAGELLPYQGLGPLIANRSTCWIGANRPDLRVAQAEPGGVSADGRTDPDIERSSGPSPRDGMDGT